MKRDEATRLKFTTANTRDVARPEKGVEPCGQANGMVMVICLLQKSYMQSWWHGRIAKGRENYWLEKAWMVVATRRGPTTNFRIVAIKSKNCMLFFI